MDTGEMRGGYTSENPSPVRLRNKKKGKECFSSLRMEVVWLGPQLNECLATVLRPVCPATLYTVNNAYIYEYIYIYIYVCVCVCRLTQSV